MVTPAPSTHASAAGTFEVKLLPLTPAFTGDSPPLARYSLDKQFSGDLEATSQGEMLSAGNVAQGSGGYVAIERVTGTLHGKAGTFALQHSGTMNRGATSLDISVIPGTGTEALAGISGTLQIIIEGKKHSYIFDYSLEGGS